MRPLIVLLLGGLAVMAPCRPALAQPASVPSPVFADASRLETLTRALPSIDRLVDAIMAERRWPGIAVGVIVDGRLVHVVTRGVQDIATRRDVTPDSVFRIASMTKSVTAVAILQLRDEGRLSLDDPIDRYLPELRSLRLPTTDAPRLTIRHLLTHTAGFPEDNPWGDRQLAQSDAWFSTRLQEGVPFSTVPGTSYEYSNLGFALLGRIVAVVSGEAFDVRVERTILRPLGMTDTTFHVERVAEARRTVGYRCEDGSCAPEVPLAHGAFGAMGGLWTSTRDLARWVTFLMSAWPARSEADDVVLSRASRREMQRVSAHTVSQTAARPGEAASLVSGGYGYGLRITDDVDFGQLIGHGGGLPGYGSLMRWLPEHGVGLIGMANVTYAGFGPLFTDIVHTLHKSGGQTPRVVQPSTALLTARDAVVRLIAQGWDDATATAIAADNLWLDRSADARRRDLDSLRMTHGACRTALPLSAENALRGQWRMACERGEILVSITLAPTQPPRVQSWTMRHVDSVAAADRASTVEETLARQAAQWDDAIVRKDAAAIAANMSTTFTHISSDGVVSDRAAFLADILHPDLSIAPYTVEGMQIRRIGDVALITGETRMTGTSRTKPFSLHYRFTDVYAREQAGWRVVHVQITAIP